MTSEENRFNKTFWFIACLTGFGMFFSVYILIRFKGDTAERFGDQLIIFWLTTAVSGGIGYLLGSSAAKIPGKLNGNGVQPGSTTADISATIHTETKPDDKPKID